MISSSRIDTFLEFMNLDLKGATQEDLLRSAMFVSSASVSPELTFRVGLNQLAPKLEKLLSDDAIMLREIQDRLKSILEGIEQWSSSKHLTDEEKQPDNNNHVFHTILSWTAPFTVSLLAQMNTPKQWDFQQSLFNETPLRLVFSCDNLLDAVVFNFCRTLEGVDFNSLKTCALCKKWLLQQTRKYKEYCSNACASKAGSKRRYEKKRADKSKTMPAKKTKREIKLHPESQ